MEGIKGRAIGRAPCKGKGATKNNNNNNNNTQPCDMYGSDCSSEMHVMGTKTPKGQLDITGSLRHHSPKAKGKHGGAPPRSGAYKRRPGTGCSTFRTFYDQGHIPILQCDTVRGCRMKWAESVPDPAALDYHHYLPLFFDGLRETGHPYKMMAEEGVHDLLAHGHSKTLSVVPQLILPIKNALESRDPAVICRTLKAIMHLCTCAEMVGEALVPYYRQILPVLNLFKCRNKNLGDQIDYGQQNNQNIGDLINETLNTLECHGGPDAYINIKYMIPTYESCVLN